MRYRRANIPLAIDLDACRLVVHGWVDRPLDLSIDALKALAEPVEVVAVNQCSGKQPGLHVATRLRRATRQWRNGQRALGRRAAGRGSREGGSATNDVQRPRYASKIEVVDHTFEGHDAPFMTTAHRVPDNDCQCVAPGSTASKTRPISTLAIPSFITSVAADAVLPHARTVELKDIAFDGGAGLAAVDVSIEGGQHWQAAVLGTDLGRLSFREWRAPVRLMQRGKAMLLVKATNRSGETQPASAVCNGAGYRRHVIESTRVTVA